MKRGVIAVIIPIYNTAEYLEDCLNSLLAQTYSEWVAYCVDDGSTDDSLRILERYADKDKRINLFHKENGGVSSARNYALKHLDGEEWISFLDSDDYLSPYMYENIMQVVNQNDDVDYVSLRYVRTRFRYAEQMKKGWSEDFPEMMCDTKIFTYENFLLEGGVRGYMAELFVRASIVVDNDILFFEEIRNMEDGVFSILCATYSKNVILLKSFRGYYYFSGNEKSLIYTMRNSVDDIIRVINRVYDIFERRGTPVLMKEYYLKMFLPAKIDSLFSARYCYHGKANAERVDKRISVPICSLSLRRLVKYVIIKLFGL